MNYVKVIGDSHADAMRKLRDTYGSEAIIYYEKEIPAKTVLSRMIGKKQFVIQAAMPEKKSAAAKAQPVTGNSKERSRLVYDAQIVSSSVSERSSASKTLSENRVSDAPQKRLASVHAGEEFLNLLDQHSENLKTRKPFNLEEVSIDRVVHPPKQPLEAGLPPKKGEILEGLQKDINVIKNTISILVNNNQKENRAETNDEFGKVFDYLVSQDFSQTWSRTLVDSLKDMVPSSEWSNPQKINNVLKELIASKIKVNSSLGNHRVIVLVGPTGVGKTTTIAKLAAKLKLQEGKKVSLITLDNFRIAATEQLKVYGNIMDIPVYVIKDSEKFHQRIEEDISDIILVDTTGISQNNNEFMSKQKLYFNKPDCDIEKHLVLSATSKYNDIKDILRNFAHYGIDKLILSKVDETTQYGAFVELSNVWNKPFSFFTTGQRVPDDYLNADKYYLSEKILKKWKDTNL